MNITWERLCELNPALVKLEADIKVVADADTGEGYFCANRHWYRTFKPRLWHEVGTFAGCVEEEKPVSDKWPEPLDLTQPFIFPERTWDVPPELLTHEAWNVAYEHLYELLPDCRHEDSIC
ncbi:MAG: hypothetical protein KKA22_03980 [Gammaproteobacteria bacterium]|nr:hypothetical protein [Gammaproteobacteria bacterium]MBU1407288.1 hypothetical protein [Gammaproteobacteria bacterium]MBU1531338.1 hypothetical protein [Gammaproteobacteria bacterium]